MIKAFLLNRKLKKLNEQTTEEYIRQLEKSNAFFQEQAYKYMFLYYKEVDSNELQ